jgi:hypothetical protein
VDIEPEIGLSFVFIRPMAGKTGCRKQRPNTVIEISIRRQFFATGHQNERPAEQNGRHNY